MLNPFIYRRLGWLPNRLPMGYRFDFGNLVMVTIRMITFLVNLFGNLFW